MPKRETEPLVRVHVWLFASDREWLDETFGPSIGMNKAVRSMVRGVKTKILAKHQQSLDEGPALDLSTEEIVDGA